METDSHFRNVILYRMINLTANQIASKKVVGKTDKGPVFLVITKGGLNLILEVDGKKVNSLGLGAHRSIAQHLASKNADVTWTELSKSESWEVSEFTQLLPQYEALTNQVRKAEQEREEKLNKGGK